MTTSATRSRVGAALRIAAAFLLGGLATFAVLRASWSPDVAPQDVAVAPRPAVEPVASASRGDQRAPVDVVVFSDFQCPFCTRLNGALDRLLREHGDTARLEFRHLPHPGHEAGLAAHRASLAAERQGRFWEMHDLLFANPQRLTRDAFLEHARAIGLELRQFERDLDDPTLGRVLDRDRAEAERLGIAEAPALVVNGRVVPGAQPYAALVLLVEQEKERSAAPSRPAFLTDPRVREWVAVSREAVDR